MKQFSLCSEYAIDQALLDQDTRIIVLRFGSDLDFKSQIFDFEFRNVTGKIRKNFVFYSVAKPMGTRLDCLAQNRMRCLITAAVQLSQSSAGCIVTLIGP